MGEMGYATEVKFARLSYQSSIVPAIATTPTQAAQI